MVSLHDVIVLHHQYLLYFPQGFMWCSIQWLGIVVIQVTVLWTLSFLISDYRRPSWILPLLLSSRNAQCCKKKKSSALEINTFYRTHEINELFTIATDLGISLICQMQIRYEQFFLYSTPEIVYSLLNVFCIWNTLVIRLSESHLFLSWLIMNTCMLLHFLCTQINTKWICLGREKCLRFLSSIGYKCYV